MKRLALIALSSLTISASAFAADYDIDPSHSTVGFSIKHMVISTVHGGFGKVSGTVSYDAKKVGDTVIDVTIEAGSISTSEENRDKHLKSADFFDVEKFASVTFKSKKVEAAGKGKLKVTGDLTLHGVTKSVTLAVTGPSAEVKSPFGKTVMAASATGTINRKDFGLTWNKNLDNGGLLVGEEVAISLDVELAKKEAAAAPAAAPAAK
jgi:polyisoprenoid-binding protein YceI